MKPFGKHLMKFSVISVVHTMEWASMTKAHGFCRRARQSRIEKCTATRQRE